MGIGFAEGGLLIKRVLKLSPDLQLRRPTRLCGLGGRHGKRSKVHPFRGNTKKTFPG
jgi:hypothetical protein